MQRPRETINLSEDNDLFPSPKRQKTTEDGHNTTNDTQEQAVEQNKTEESADQNVKNTNGTEHNNDDVSSSSDNVDDEESEESVDLSQELAKLTPEEEKEEFNQWLTSERESGKTVQQIFSDAGFASLAVRFIISCGEPVVM